MSWRSEGMLGGVEIRTGLLGMERAIYEMMEGIRARDVISGDVYMVDV